jgi:hypothetical protein
MRVLLDECVPQRLGREIVGHDVRTVADMGWASKKNGELLGLAQGLFDVFVTTDQKLSYQQNLTGISIGVAVLVAQRNKIEFLRPLLPELLRRLPDMRPGEVSRIGG